MRSDYRDVHQYTHRQEKSLKDVMTTPPMTEEQHKAVAAKRRDARRSIEDREMEKELLKR